MDVRRFDCGFDDASEPQQRARFLAGRDRRCEQAVYENLGFVQTDLPSTSSLGQKRIGGKAHIRISGVQDVCISHRLPLHVHYGADTLVQSRGERS